MAAVECTFIFNVISEEPVFQNAFIGLFVPICIKPGDIVFNPEYPFDYARVLGITYVSNPVNTYPCLILSLTRSQ